MHRTSGRWFLGLGLSLLSALFYGLLPIVLTVTLQAVDVYTVCWFRFLVSFILLALFLGIRGELSKLQQMPFSAWALLAITALFFMGDKLGYIEGLALTSSANTQVIKNLTFPLLGLGGLVIFKERYTLHQWLGLGVLVCGYVLFFHEQMAGLMTNQGAYMLGNVLIFLAAVAGAGYALLQKQLLTSLSSAHTLLIFYGISTLLFTPLAQVETVFHQSNLVLVALLCCPLVSMVYLGTQTESLKHLSASKVSAVLALTPISTVICCELMSLVAPGLIPKESLTAMAIFGAGFVVFGSAMTALAKSD